MIAIGDVDEANSAIGVAIAAMRLPPGSIFQTQGPDWMGGLLERIQNDLFDLGADLATPGTDFTPSKTALRIVPAQVARLESEIDSMNADLHALTSFILPGGDRFAAALHLARAITRRAERSAVAAAGSAPLNPVAITYLNRLSDYLFVAARRVNKDASGDVLWIPGGSVRQV